MDEVTYSVLSEKSILHGISISKLARQSLYSFDRNVSLHVTNVVPKLHSNGTHVEWHGKRR